MSNEQYGINVQNHQVIQTALEPQQFMTDILRERGVEPAIVEELERKSQSVFDVRGMRAGRPITLIIHNETRKLDFFIYEKTDASYVVYDLTGNISVYEGQKKVRLRTREVGGTITGSLYESVQAADLDLRLIPMLEEVFSWTVDFLQLDEGDYFRVVYEEELVDGFTIGLNRIVAAQIRQKGTDYYAIYFAQDTLADYYDLKGRSLKRAFLPSPFPASVLATGVAGKPRFTRYGTDFPAPISTPVVATADGEIIDMGQSQKKGHYLTIRHNGLFVSQYLYLNALAEGLEMGSQVQQEDVIGEVGQRYGKNMIRYRLWDSGKSIPLSKAKVPKSQHIQPENEQDFARTRDRLLKQLQQIAPKSEDGAIMATR